MTDGEPAEAHRIRLYHIQPVAMLEHLKTGNAFGVVDGIPSDASFWTAGFDHERQSFYVIAEHPTFEAIPTGEPIPEGDPATFENIETVDNSTKEVIRRNAFVAGFCSTGEGMNGEYAGSLSADPKQKALERYQEWEGSE